MFTNLLRITSMVLISFSGQAQQADHSAEHGGQLYHRFQLEAGTGINEHDQQLTDWELDGWSGSDKNRLRLDGNGLHTSGSVEQAEFRFMYSRNLSTFWDAQIGLRQDIRPDPISYLTLGIEGLAPYFFETNLHAFISEKGDVSIRLRQENDLLISQRLIIQPYLEAELYLQDIPERKAGNNLSKLELGLQLRYDVTRKFAPYVDIKYERNFWNISSSTRINGEEQAAVIATAGFRLIF